MNQRTHRSLRNITHPYIFILKEGMEILQNPLDYSLMMLFIQSNETIRSPEENRSFFLNNQKK